MSFIEVYFNSSLQDTIEVSDHPVSIGRAAHNQIQINNKGVSLLHAVITKKDKEWYVEDLNSTNSTFLNGVKVEGKKQLKFGDTVSICKHELKFVNARSQVAQAKHAGGQQQEDEERTIMVRAPRAESLETKPKVHNCQLLVYGEARNINKLLLSKDSYTIGKAKECDLRVGGWFTPKYIAELIRIGESYYLSPISRRLVKVNGRDAVTRMKLSNDDNIQIKKMLLKFVQE